MKKGQLKRLWKAFKENPFLLFIAMILVALSKKEQDEQ
jgi:hypothetical protein